MNHRRHDSFVYWAIWVFAAAFAALIALTACAAGNEALALNQLPAPQGAGLQPCDASRVAGLGVGQPRHHGAKNENAVESILSRPERWSRSWCGFRDKTILQWPAIAFATRSPAAPRCGFWKFPGVTVNHGGADALGIRESNTASAGGSHAAPGSFFGVSRGTSPLVLGTSAGRRPHA
jgi:hypothetical protein